MLKHVIPTTTSIVPIRYLDSTQLLKTSDSYLSFALNKTITTKVLTFHFAIYVSESTLFLKGEPYFILKPEKIYFFHINE